MYERGDDDEGAEEKRQYYYDTSTYKQHAAETVKAKPQPAPVTPKQAATEVQSSAYSDFDYTVDA